MTNYKHRFLDYSERYKSDGAYASLTGLKFGFCKIYPAEDGRGYILATEFRSKHGRSYHWHPTYEEALNAGWKWARRRLELSADIIPEDAGYNGNDY
jgi:hypothetical protein